MEEERKERKTKEKKERKFNNNNSVPLQGELGSFLPNPGRQSHLNFPRSVIDSLQISFAAELQAGVH